MKEAIKMKTWCYNNPCPDPAYAKNLDELFKVGARVDAWRKFFGSSVYQALEKLKGRIIWFSPHEAFDKLLCELGDINEEIAITTITELMRPGHEQPVEFLRTDIYDDRAWARIPLNVFVALQGTYFDRTTEDMFGHEVPKFNQMPIVKFGIRKPWTVTRDCFRFDHKIKKDQRYAQISFSHPQIDYRFEGRRWCADGLFPRSATPAEMQALLWVKVIDECRKHQVTIADAE